MRKLEIARSFSMTKQVKQYEPIQVFASYKAEIGEGEDEKKISEELYKRAKADVENAIKDYQKPETTEEEVGVVEGNLSVSERELIVLKRHPEENSEKIKLKKFEVDLFKSLIKDLKK